MGSQNFSRSLRRNGFHRRYGGSQNFPRCLGENGFHKRKGWSTDKQGNFIEFHQSLTLKFCPQPPHCCLLHVAHKIISIKETHNPKLQ